MRRVNHLKALPPRPADGASQLLHKAAKRHYRRLWALVPPVFEKRARGARARLPQLDRLAISQLHPHILRRIDWAAKRARLLSPGGPNHAGPFQRI